MQKRRLSCLVLASGVTTILLVSAGGSAASFGPQARLDDAPPLGGTPPPAPTKIKPCGYVTGKAAVVNRVTEQHATICGSPQADKITATGGYGHIETFGGADYINARNGKPDDVWAGPGADQLVVDTDTCDTVHDGERVQKAAARCKGVSASSGLHALMSVTPADYPGYLPTMDCRINDKGGREIRFARYPAMRAVDVTKRVDWQNVAWSALNYKWDGSRWVLISQTEWLWDRAYDEQVEAFPGNYWRRFTTNQRWFVWFTPRQPGIYRVAIHYRWYAAPGVPAYDLTVWAGRHLGEYERLPDRTQCEFPGATPPPPTGGVQTGHYTGTTAPGSGVQLDVGSNGTSFSNLVFAPAIVSGSCSQAGLGVFQNGFYFNNNGHPFGGTIAADGSFAYNETYNINVTAPGFAGVPGQVNVSVNGRFTNAGTVSGTISYNVSFVYQGVQANCPANNVAWSAKK